MDLITNACHDGKLMCIFAGFRCGHMPGFGSLWYLPHLWLTGHHLHGVAGPTAGLLTQNTKIILY